MFQRGLLSSSSCLNKPKGPVQRKHAGIKIQNISRLARMEQAASDGYGFVRWWSCSGKHFTLFYFIFVYGNPSFGLFLPFLNIHVYLKPFYLLSNPFLPASLRYMFKATSRFYEVNPLLQRSDQIRVHAAHCPPLHSAPAPRSLCLQDQGFRRKYMYLFCFRASRKARLRFTFPPPESLQGQHRPDNTCSSELLLL